MVRILESQNVDVYGDVESNLSHKSPLFYVLVEVFTIATRKYDSAELPDAVLEHPSVSSGCQVGLSHGASNSDE